MGEHLSPRYGQVILVSGYPVSTAVNCSQRWCPKCVHYQFSCAPELAIKYGIEHWCPVVRTDGRCTVTWLPDFLGWVDLLSYAAPSTRARGAPLWKGWTKSTQLFSNLFVVNHTFCLFFLFLTSANGKGASADSMRGSSKMKSNYKLRKEYWRWHGMFGVKDVVV